MRGGAQAHLLEADDGRWYVVKFPNNPQQRRVLVNEALSAELLKYLKISVPRDGADPSHPRISGSETGLLPADGEAAPRHRTRLAVRLAKLAPALLTACREAGTNPFPNWR